MVTAASVIETKIRRRLNETATDFHAQADLLAYIDEAQQYVVRKTKCTTLKVKN